MIFIKFLFFTKGRRSVQTEVIWNSTQKSTRWNLWFQSSYHKISTIKIF